MADPIIPDMTQPANKDPPPTVPPVSGDPPNVEAVWKQFHDTMTKDDKELIDGWNGDIDTLLILAGLFSAVVTAFIIESYQSLQEDPNASSSTVLLLSQILHQLNNTAPQMPNSSSFQPPSSAVRLNIFWFLSLVLALVSALFSLVVKQWLREYLRSLNGASAQLQVRVRQARYSGLMNWHVPEIVSALSLLLQGAVILFVIGLVDFLFQLTPQVAQPILAFSVLSFSLLLLSTLIPSMSFTCPYRSPLSWIVLGLLHYFYILAWQIIGFPQNFDTWLNEHHLTSTLPFIDSDLNLRERIKARMYGLFIMILLKPLWHSVPKILLKIMLSMPHWAATQLQPITIWEKNWVARDSSVFSEQSASRSSKDQLIEPSLLHSYDSQALIWVYNTSLDPIRLSNILVCAESMGPQAVDDWLLMWMSCKADDLPGSVISYLPLLGAMDYGYLLQALSTSWGSAITEGTLSQCARFKTLFTMLQMHGIPDIPDVADQCLHALFTMAHTLTDHNKSAATYQIGDFLMNTYLPYYQQQKQNKPSAIQSILTWARARFRDICAIHDDPSAGYPLGDALKALAGAIDYSLDISPGDMFMHGIILPAVQALWQEITATCTAEKPLDARAQTFILEAISLFHAYLPQVLNADMVIGYLIKLSFDPRIFRFLYLTQLAVVCALRLGFISRDEVDELPAVFHPPLFKKIHIGLSGSRHEGTVFEHVFQCICSWCKTTGIATVKIDEQRALGLVLVACLKNARRTALHVCPEQEQQMRQLHKQLKQTLFNPLLLMCAQDDPAMKVVEEQGREILGEMIKLAENVKHIIRRSKSLPELQNLPSVVKADISKSKRSRYLQVQEVKSKRRMSWPLMQLKRPISDLQVPNNTPTRYKDKKRAFATVHYQISEADRPLRTWARITSQPGGDRESTIHYGTPHNGASVTAGASPTVSEMEPAAIPQDVIPDAEAPSQNLGHDVEAHVNATDAQRRGSYSSDDMNSMEEGKSGMALADGPERPL